MRAKINLNHGDCMDAMSEMQDDHVTILAIVDPPYGIGADSKNSTDKKQSTKSATEGNNYGSQRWDSTTPEDFYFEEVIRVSKNQIIWGVNYYTYILKGGRIYWDKCVTMPTYSDGELAYCSQLNSIRSFKYAWHGMIQNDMKNKEQRIHPTQKPVALYRWLLENYAKEGNTILDTHGGSMSIALACWDLKYDLDLWELDEDYYNAGKKRFEDYTAQGQFNF